MEELRETFYAARVEREVEGVEFVVETDGLFVQLFTRFCERDRRILGAGGPCDSARHFRLAVRGTVLPHLEAVWVDHGVLVDPVA